MAVEHTFRTIGGKLLGWYLTQGPYDVVTITQFPDAKTAMTALMATGMQGNVRTETMRAFSAAEFKDMAAKLP